MKGTNLISKAPKQQLKSENINAIEQVGRWRLIEKYKPKYYCNIDTMSDSKNERRVD